MIPIVHLYPRVLDRNHSGLGHENHENQTARSG